MQIFRHVRLEVLFHLLKPGLSQLIASSHSRVSMRYQVNTAKYVVKNDHIVGDHENNVRRSKRVWRCALPYFLLNIANRVITKVTHQPASIDRQILKLRVGKPSLELFDKGQRILNPKLVSYLTRFL